MNSGKQYIYGFIVFIGLGFMGWYYAQPQQISTIPHEQLIQLPDAIVTQLKVSKFNDAGQLASQVATPKLTHYPANNTSKMQHPMITLYRPQQPPWTITANHGISEQGSTKITLWDTVIMHQDAGKNNNASTITTAKIIYYPKQQLATTDQEIRLQQPGITVTSTGMNAYLNQQRVQLLQQAKGRYVKQN